MNLQDIHKEFKELFPTFLATSHEGTFVVTNSNENKIEDFYDKKIVEIIKECVPMECDVFTGEKKNNNSKNGWNCCRERIIENLKARNINLD